MTYTLATVVAYNGERGIAYDHYDNAIHFAIKDVHPQDRPHLREGSNVMYNSMTGRIELADGNFSRFVSFSVGDPDGSTAF